MSFEEFGEKDSRPSVFESGGDPFVRPKISKVSTDEQTKTVLKMIVSQWYETTPEERRAVVDYLLAKHEHATSGEGFPLSQDEKRYLLRYIYEIGRDKQLASRKVAFLEWYMQALQERLKKNDGIAKRSEYGELIPLVSFLQQIEYDGRKNHPYQDELAYFKSVKEAFAETETSK